MDERIVLKKLGKAIRQRRIFLKMTQEELADSIDVQTKLISSLENGRYFLSAKTYNKLYKGLKFNEIDIMTFLNESDSDNSKRNLINEISKILNGLKDDEVETCKDVLCALVKRFN